MFISKKYLIAVSAIVLTLTLASNAAYAANDETKGNEDFYRELTELVNSRDGSNYFTEISLTVGSTTLRVDGEQQNLDCSPEVLNGRTMLPMRAVAEAVGAEVSYDSSTKSAIIMSSEGTEITCPIGTNKMMIDGEILELDVSSYAKEGRTFLPVRAVAEALDLTVTWEQATSSITISAPYQSARLLIFADESFHMDSLNASAMIYDGAGMWVAQFASAAAAKAASELLNAHGVASQPDLYIAPVEEAGLTETDNQAMSHLGWGAVDCRFDDFISKNKGLFSGSETIAIVDSGIDATHPFLNGRVLSGYDFVDGDSNPYDEYFHGTHVASIAVDCVGSAPVRILPVRVLGRNGSGYSSVVATGIKYAADHGADVINLSLGGGHDIAKENAIEYALKKGTVITIAAGNENADTAISCPAHITTPGAVVVSSGNSNHKKAQSSNYGRSVDLMAPGVSIKGAVPGRGYEILGGTSMAAPHVAAAIALLDLVWGKSLSPAELETKLYTATTNGKRIDNYYGYGFLNMLNASVPTSGVAPVELPQPAHSSVSVPAGTYYIEAYCGKVVEVADSKTSDRANVQIWTLSARNLGCQKFQIEGSDDTYVIKATHSGKAIDVADGSTENGANVWQWHINSTKAQTWSFEDANDGYVYIRSALGTYLEVSDNRSANGTNIRVQKFNGDTAQKFKLVSTQDLEPSEQLLPKQPISVMPGTYYIEAYCGKVVEVEDSRQADRANVQIWDLSKRNLGCQKFRIKKSGDYYTISAVHSGKMLDIADGSSESGTNIWQWHGNNTKAQQWTFEDAGEGYVYIKSALGTYLDVYDNRTANGTNVWAYRFNGSAAQKFLLKQV